MKVSGGFADGDQTFLENLKETDEAEEKQLKTWLEASKHKFEEAVCDISKLKHSKDILRQIANEVNKAEKRLYGSERHVSCVGETFPSKVVY